MSLENLTTGSKESVFEMESEAGFQLNLVKRYRTNTFEPVIYVYATGLWY
jgi:hypothetical protein